MAKKPPITSRKSNQTDKRKKPRPIPPTGGGQVGSMTGTGGGTM